MFDRVLNMSLIISAETNWSLRKISKFQLISWCGNFVGKQNLRSVSGDSLFEKLGEITVFYAVNLVKTQRHSLSEKCPYSEFFQSVFSRIRTEYGPEKLE